MGNMKLLRGLIRALDPFKKKGLKKTHVSFLLVSGHPWHRENEFNKGISALIL